MALLNQVIAVEKGIKAATHSLKSELYKLVQKPSLFSGFSKTYQKRNEDDEDFSPETQKVQRTVASVLTELQTSLADLWQVTARKEWSNMAATADVAVGATVLGAKAPVTYLLFLEKELTDLRTFLESVPVLEQTEDWAVDASTGLYRTAPVQTHRTKKVQKPIVLYDATTEHPAQTQLISEDVLVGYWHTVKYSGALTQPDKYAMAQRVEALLRAVKQAREAANSSSEVQPPPVVEQLLRYVFTGA